MNVNQLFNELLNLKMEGYGELPVKYDFGAVEVNNATVDVDTDKEKYVHLDW